MNSNIQLTQTYLLESMKFLLHDPPEELEEYKFMINNIDNLIKDIKYIKGYDEIKSMNEYMISYMEKLYKIVDYMIKKNIKNAFVEALRTSEQGREQGVEKNIGDILKGYLE